LSPSTILPPFDITTREECALVSTSVQKCEHCGSTIIEFDPATELKFELGCGAVKPGTYASGHPGGIPYCMLSEGHEGEHQHIVEYVDSWSDEDALSFR